MAKKQGSALGGLLGRARGGLTVRNRDETPDADAHAPVELGLKDASPAPMFPPPADPGPSTEADPPAEGELDGREFEVMVAEVFRFQGFDVTAVPNGTDGGTDLELRMDGMLFLARCRHWKDRDVGVELVRELVETVATRSADAGFLVASGDFNDLAREQADEHGTVVLINGRALRRMVAEAAGHPELAVPADTLAAPPCPSCGLTMVDRVADQGPNEGQHFWGCSSYPECWGTREMRQRRSEDDTPDF